MKKSNTGSSLNNPLPVIILSGPTGAGKTELAARMLSGRCEIISADAVQVYKGLDIGSAKPSESVLQQIPHHLINLLPYDREFNIAEFRRLADQAVKDIHARGLIPTICGGSVYYIRAWLYGLPETPAADPAIRRRLEEEWKSRSSAELHSALHKADPPSASRIALRDRYRALRALEVFEQTGKPLSSFSVPSTPRRDYRLFFAALRHERSVLYERINVRVERMFQAGLPGEAAALKAQGARADHPGMKAIGYREWFAEDEDGKALKLPQVKELIARNTRRYAKRQMTFLSSFPELSWFDAAADPFASGGLARAVDEFLL